MERMLMWRESKRTVYLIIRIVNGWGESEMYIQRRTEHIIDVNCNHRMCAGIVCAPSCGYNIQEIVECIINIQKIITVYE